MNTPDNVINARQRAEQVVNGFTKVREQQARDVLTCTAYIAQLEHANDTLLKRVHELNKASGAKAETFSDVFGDIFGGITGGKKP